MTIYSQRFDIQDEVSLSFPKDSIILSVQMQGEMIAIWYYCDPALEIVNRRFRVYGTGHPVGAFPLGHLGTLQHYGFVWHVFEV